MGSNRPVLVVGCDVVCFLLLDNLFTSEAAGNETCVACPAGSHADGELIAPT